MTNSTIDRILDAAEVEFAAHGFVETSLRTITTKAKVNLAAVNYHFGSKKGLIQAVTDRFLGPLTQHLQNQLSAYEKQPSLDSQNQQELQALFTLLAH